MTCDACQTWIARCQQLEEQLEAAREALRRIAFHSGIPTEGAYGERLGPEVEMRTIARNAYDSNPATEPEYLTEEEVEALDLAQADRDLAEGRARPASEVFADSDPASEPPADWDGEVHDAQEWERLHRPACVCGEINTRHCPVHAGGSNQDTRGGA